MNTLDLAYHLASSLSGLVRVVCQSQEQANALNNTYKHVNILYHWYPKAVDAMGIHSAYTIWLYKPDDTSIEYAVNQRTQHLVIYDRSSGL